MTLYNNSLSQSPDKKREVFVRIASFCIALTALLAFVPLSGVQGAPGSARIAEFPIAVQCWTFHKFSFYETLDAMKELGIRNVQAYPGQALDSTRPDVVFDHAMSEETMRAVKDKLKKSGVKVTAYGVVGFENTEASMRKVFDFAKKMGIETVVCEPAFDDWTLLARLAREYKLTIAIHNHPLPSKYARPEAVLKQVKDLNSRFGSCADNGHWSRAGVNPMEAFQMLDGRIRDLHLKDLDRVGSAEAVDVPFGTGVSGVRDILAEMTRQKYRGCITIEYENPADEDNPSPAVRKCVEYLKKVSGK